MLEALPDDLLELVQQHAACMLIQRRYRRWSLYAHARRGVWSDARRHLGQARVRALWPFPAVRREWRREPESWCAATTTQLHVLIMEATGGMWGRPTRAEWVVAG